MDRPLTVSVVIPAFNRERLLPRALQSVRDQSFADWEVIVVDDRSKDRTAEIVQEFASHDARIRYCRNERPQGPAGARNHGVALARGEFIAFLDSDDEWMPFHLARAVRHLRQDALPIDVFTANPIRRRSDSGDVIKYDLLDLEAFSWKQHHDLYVIESAGLWERGIEGKRILTTQTIVARRAVFDKVRWDEEIFGMEDCLFPLEVAFHGFRIGHCQDFHVTYWVHDDNLTNGDGKHDPRRMLPVLEACVKLQKAILRKFPLSAASKRKIEQALAEQYVWSLGYNGYGALGEQGKARACYWKALALCPTRFSYWKTLCASYLKSVTGRLRQGRAAAVNV